MLCAAAATAAAVLLQQGAARGAVVYWDTNGSTAGAGGPSATGTWDGTTANWNGQSDGTGVVSSWVSGDTAVFAAGADATGAYTVTVPTAQTAGGIIVEEGAVSLTGAATVSLGTGDVHVNPGATLSVDNVSRLSFNPGATVTLDGGTLGSTNPGVGGSIVSSNAAIVLTSNGGTINIPVAGAAVVYNGTIVPAAGAGTTTLTKTGVGDFRNTAGTFSKLVINQGLFRAVNTGNETAFGAVPPTLDPSAVTVAAGAAVGTSVSVTSPATRGFTLSGGTATFVTSSSWTINGPISGAGALALNGNGFNGANATFTLNGTNTYAGSTTINLGQLSANGGSAIPDTSAVVIPTGVANTANLRINSNETVGSVAGGNPTFGGIILSAAGINLTTGADNTSTTFAGVISGAGALTKVGTGTMTLSGANTYTGGTTLTGPGALRLTGAQGAGTGPITLAGGTLTVLSDTALSLPNAVTVTGNASVTADHLATGSNQNVTFAGGLTIGSQALTASAGSGYGITFGTVTLTGNPTFATPSASLSLGAINDGGTARTINANTNFPLNFTAAASSLIGTVNHSGGNLHATASGALGTATINNSNGGALFLDAANAAGGPVNASSGIVFYAANDASGGSNAVTANGTGPAAAEIRINAAVTSVGTDTFVVNAGNVLGIESTTAGLLGVGSNLTLANGAIVADISGAANNATGSNVISNLGTGNSYFYGLGLSNMSASMTLGASGGTTAWKGLSTDVSSRTLLTGTITAASNFFLQGANFQTLTVGNGTAAGSVSIVSSAAPVMVTTLGNVTLNDTTPNFSGVGTFNVTGGGQLTLAASGALGATGAAAGVVVNGADSTSVESSVAALAGGAINGAITVNGGATPVNFGGGAILGVSGAFSGAGRITVNAGARLDVQNFSTAVNGPITLNAGAILRPSVPINTASGGSISRDGSNGNIIVDPQVGTALTGTLFGSGNIIPGDIVRLGVNNITGIDNTNTAGNVTGAAIYEMYIINHTQNAGLYLDGGMLTEDNASRNWSGTGSIVVGPAGGTFAATTGQQLTVLSAVAASSNPLTIGSTAVIDPNAQQSTTLTKAGTVNFNGGLTAGPVTVAAGNLNFSGAVNLAGLTNNAGTVQYTSGAALTIAGGLVNNGGVVTFNGAASVGSLAGAANVNLSGGAALTVGADNTNTIYSGALAGNGSLTKTGSGTLTLTGANSFSGTATINGGTLAVSADLNLGVGVVTVINNGTLATTGTFSTGRTFTLTNSASMSPATGTTLTVSDPIGGTGSLYKVGGGTLVLAAASNNYGGDTNVNAGTLSVASNAQLGLGSQLFFNGGTLATTASMTIPRSVSVGNASSALDVGAANTVTLNGAISGNGSLIKTGAGALVISGTQNWSAGATLAVGGGTVQFSSNAGGGGAGLAVNASGGDVAFAAPQSLAGLTVAAGRTASITSGGGTRALKTSALNLAGTSSAWTGTLDLADHSLIVDVAPGAETANLNTVTNQVRSGLNLASGFWNGSGITSSTAAADAPHLKGIGIGVAGDLFGISGTSTATFAGQTVDGSSILATYTYVGDANLDGKVDLFDFNLFAVSYGQSNAGWHGGDFNYDGITDKDNDFAIMIDAYQDQGTPITPQIAQIIQQIEGVPEPTGGAILIASAAAALTRRRRRQRRQRELGSGRGVQ